MTDPEAHARQLAAESLSRDEPTGWFELLYAAAEADGAVVPWDRGAPHPLLAEWTTARRLDGTGRRAAVVGCGLGSDAEHIAGLGFDTLAFDIAPSAVRAARERFPRSGVLYVTGDLLDPPAAWHEAFDLVLESLTVQSLPPALRAAATAGVRGLVAPGGTLLVIATARDGDGPVSGPPWPLTGTDVEAFAAGGLEAVRVDELGDRTDASPHRWRAEFRRPR
jgi:SAM-dependent methyltransferase